MVCAAPDGSIVGSVRGSARIGPPRKQAHTIVHNVPENSHKCLAHVQTGVGDVRRNFPCFRGGDFAVRGTPKGGVWLSKMKGVESSKLSDFSRTPDEFWTRGLVLVHLMTMLNLFSAHNQVRMTWKGASQTQSWLKLSN